MRFVAIHGSDASDGAAVAATLHAPEGDRLRSPAADTRCVVFGADDAPVAQCALWWRDTPRYQHHRVGLIGHYRAGDPDREEAESSGAAAEGVDAAAGELLASACEQLARRGCTLAVGPMNGSTWHSYRFVTHRGGEAPFAMEPTNPSRWPEHFREAGFHTLATYASAVARRLDIPDARLHRAHDRFAGKGIHIRNIRLEDFDGELLRVHGVASVSFRDNLLYSPIATAQFLAQYRLIRPAIDPRMVFLAEQAGRPVGFVFLIPDSEQAARGEPVDTAILKTLAVLPGSTYAGLGAYLVARGHERAHELGYRRVIHALMRDSNAAMAISRKSAAPMRRYALFSKPMVSSS